jgi:phage tail sheath protein FI
MAVQVSYPGVYIQEEPSGARAIAAVPTAIAAFIGMTKRGRLNEPTRIANLAAFERTFGLETERGDLPDAVAGFFTNGGGLCYVVRVAEGAERATVELNDEAGRATLRLTARDHGTDGNLIRAEVDYPTPSLFSLTLYRRRVDASGVAQIEGRETFENLSMDRASGRFVETIVNAGSALVEATAIYNTADIEAESVSIAGLIPPSGANAALLAAFQPRFTASTGAFAISVDGQRSIIVTVNQPTTDAEAGDFFNHLQNTINTRLVAEGLSGSVTVTRMTVANSVPNGRFLRFARAGGSIAITPAPLNDIAGRFFLGTASGGIEIDRHAILRPAPTGVVARIHSAGTTDLGPLRAFAASHKNQLTGFTLTDASPDSPHVVPPGTLGFASAPASETMYVGTRFVPGAADTALGAFVNVVENLAALASAIEANTSNRWRAEVQGLRLALTPTFGDSDSDLTARLTTQGGTDIGAAGGMFDAAPALSAYNVAAYSLGQTGGVGGAGPYQDGAGATAGADGNIPQIDQYRTAFTRIERDVDIFNLMILPRADDGTNRQTDADRAQLWGEASAFCARRRAFLLVDPPSDPGPTGWATIDDVIAGVDTLRIGVETRSAAAYWPRLQLGDGRMLDPAGPIAGVMARIDGNRGVWKAPAGLEATVRGVRGVERQMSDADNGLINPRAVNALRVFPAGVVVWGARTLVGFDGSGNIDDKYIPVRRTMLFIEESLYRGLQFAVFEPNDEPLWAQIRLATGSFMNGLFRQGAFAGQKASDAYFVLCDATTTTQTDINLGIVNVVVGFAPLKPAEFVIITIRQIAGQTQV